MKTKPKIKMITETRTEKQKKPNTRRKLTEAAVMGPNTRRDYILAIFVIVVTCSLKSLTDGAVVRPTIFSDLPLEAQPAASQQQQQQQQQQPQQTSNQQTQHLNNNHHHWHQADGPQTQKINPLKSRFCTGPNNLRLDHALGLQSGTVDDLSLSASSFSNEQVRPHLARLNQNLLGGAWCPMKPISPGTFGQEWIQVKFNRSFVISAIETQGRFALGGGKEFVPSYQIVYSRNNGLTWHKWKDFRGSSLLRANDDVNTGVRNELSPPIVGANVIRILPFSQHLRTVCLRLELYGCQYDEGAPVSYTTNDGVVEPRWGHLIDYTYDGLRHRTGQLSGGLGQLVDGVKGPDNFSFNNGFEWVGWKSMNGDVVIEFTFKTLRNFTGALFHSNNLFSSGVEVFQSVDVHYGIDINLSMDALNDSLHERERRQSQLQPGGALSRPARQLNDVPTLNGQQQAATVWSSDVLSIEYEPDKKAESSRPVTVHLKQRLANKLRFVLKFASKWILISEVEFLSHPVELMSLASLNEQLTPQLKSDLRPAKTYDQYVAILREHQLRRIAADEYLNMNGLFGSGSTTTTTTTTTSTMASSTTAVIGTASDQQLSDQQPDVQMRPAESQPLDTDSSLNKKIAWSPVWQNEMSSPANAGPSTNPLLGNQPPYPVQTNFLDQPSVTMLDKINQINDSDQQQQQQRPRTIGLATVISFVLVGIFAFVGVLFAVSSYRLRCRSPKMGSPTALPRHLHNGQGGVKGFMNSMFAASAGSSASSGDSSAGSLHNTNNYRHHMTLGHHTHSQHHNSQQNQLLVSLKDSISSNGKCKSTGKSQAISTQLIVGLNQANPLAHQQIYNQQQAIYGQHQQQLIQQSQNNPYNSMSLTSSSTLNGNASGNQQAAEYSLAASADYAAPDLQPIIQTGGQQPNQTAHYNQHQLAGQTAFRQAFANGDTFRGSARAFHPNRLVPIGGAQLEHNYEQINGDPTSNGEMRPSIGINNTIHHHHRTFSNQQQQSQTANLVCGQQAVNSMTLSNGSFASASRVARQQHQTEPSHYYYADTEAAKSCLGK